MTITLLILIFLAVGALAVASYAIITETQRRAVVERAAAGSTARSRTTPITVGAKAKAKRQALIQHLTPYAPTSWTQDKKAQDKLVQAGYDDPMAPMIFASIRLGALLLLPTVGFFLGLQATFGRAMLLGAIGTFLGVFAPPALLERKIRQRQDRIRKSVPDAMDLLLVCVEAGVSLDAAILRVARELQNTHKDVAYEFLVVNRKTNAGVTRDEALRGLALRTGVDDLKALVASMIQSEKWGTSIAQVLRVNAESLRRKRRQAAEKQAAMAPIKMTIPLVTLILPTLFVVIIGPLALQAAMTLKR